MALYQISIIIIIIEMILYISFTGNKYTIQYCTILLADSDILLAAKQVF